MKRLKVIGLLILLIVQGWVGELGAQTRIKDIVNIDNGHRLSLIGYGLVVGLGGTGDRPNSRRGAVFTVQSISNMLERFGITVPREQLRTRNVAAVMVTAQVPAFSHVGTSFDVVVSSLGDATSLEGGVLLMTPLRDASGQNYALAQGPLSVGGYNVQTGYGEQLRKNHALVGRIPNGGYLQVEPPHQNIDLQQPISLVLNEPDFVTARRIAQRINAYFSADSAQKEYAQPISPGLIQLHFPDSTKSPAEAVNFIAQIETLSVNVDVEARVVINERTGTIVAGGNVRIDEVMISHGNLTIHTMSAPVISQPAPFSRVGRTVVTRVTQTTAQEGNARTAVIKKTTSVSDLASALNTLGLKPRDIIAIFQAIKQAGALKAKLIID